MKQINDLIFNKNNLLSNFEEIKRIVGTTKVCAVVKADAYGVGVETVVSALKNKVDFFAVSTISEAMEVRQQDWETPVLILVPLLCLENLEICELNRISIAVQNLKQLEEICSSGRKISVHIKINSGLNRFGTKNIKEFCKMQECIKNSRNVVFEGIFTHFGSADFADQTYLEKQFNNFQKFVKKIDKKQFNPIVHCGNSACAVLGGKFHQNMVRVGKILYGYNPLENVKKLNLKPVIELKSKIINLTSAKSGEYVGYSNNYSVKKPIKIAVVQIGFADGIRRALSNCGRVIIKNTYCNIIGNICMDSFMVDVSHLKNLKLGEDVTIIGKTKSCEICVSEIAKLCNTTIYEILTALKTKRMNII